MRTFNKLIGIAALAVMLLLTMPLTGKAQGDYISDQEFYDELQPYGTWISDPRYGNVWVPDAEEGFRPYASRGHWVLTEYGNTWVSDYPWGWATFHYGRWRYDDYYGWEWIPGHHWAPAWVSWRHGGGYYGWAPLLPGISIGISFGGGYHVPDNYWVCAPQAYVNNPNVYNYYVPQSRSVTIIQNTTIINNTYINNNQTYIAGPRQEEIREATHQNVRVYRINNADRPGNERVGNNTVNIYRPTVQSRPDAQPARLVDGAAYRQQNPNQAIANRGEGGAPAFNHNNAARLATIARNPAPDNNIVRVNPVNNRPNNNQQNSRQGQQVQQQTGQQPQQQQDQRQQRQQQQAQQQRQQQTGQQPQDQRQQRQQPPVQQQQPQLDQKQQRQQQQAQQQPQLDQRQQRQQQQTQQAQQQQAQQRQQQQTQQAQQQAQQRQQQQAQQQAQQQRQQQQPPQQQQRQQPPQQQPPPPKKPPGEHHDN